MNYEDIPFLIPVIAETVCSQLYQCQELGDHGYHESEIVEIEVARQRLTLDQIAEFARLCDARCRAAFDIQAEWFMKCVRSKSNRGRDQMYVWIRHWMVAYIRHPHHFRHESTRQPKELPCTAAASTV